MKNLEDFTNSKSRITVYTNEAEQLFAWKEIEENLYQVVQIFKDGSQFVYFFKNKDDVDSCILQLKNLKKSQSEICPLSPLGME